MKALRPFIRLLLPHRDWVIWSLLCGLLTLLSSVGLLAVSGWFLSATAVAGLSIAAAQGFNIFTPSASIRGFAVTRTAGRYAERIISHEATLRLLTSLRVWFYRQIEPQAPANLYRQRSGDLLSRIVGDIDTLDPLFIRVLSPTIVATGVALVAAAFLWWLEPALAFIFLIFFCSTGVLLPLLSRHLGQHIGAQIQHRTAHLRTNLMEDLQGLADLTVYGALQRQRLLRLAESDQLLSLQEKMARINGFNSAMMTLLSGLTAATALYVAIPLAQEGRFSGSFLALITFGILATFEALLPLPSAWQLLGKICAAAKRLLEITDTPATITFPAQPAPAPATFGVHYRNISFSYPGTAAATVIQQINLHIAPGSTLALVGLSGCGKTTLAQLLTRFWDPDQGQICVDDTDIKQFTETQLRQMMTMVAQKSHIFSATLRDNLLLAQPQATDDHLWDVLQQAQLAEFVAGLPQGLDTWAGEAGARLSGGQARRLILARALLKNAPIWILDEPTEGLDNLTRHAFGETLFRNLQGKTTLLITHNHDLLERIDQIAFMEQGKIISTGQHRIMLDTCERYRHFIESRQSGAGPSA